MDFGSYNLDTVGVNRARLGKSRISSSLETDSCDHWPAMAALPLGRGADPGDTGYYNNGEYPSGSSYGKRVYSDYSSVLLPFLQFVSHELGSTSWVDVYRRSYLDIPSLRS